MSVVTRTTRPARAGVATGPTTGGWWSVTEHWLRNYRRVWFGSAITSFLAPLLYLAGMGLGLGMLVDRGAGGIDGVPYVAFIAPGVLVMTAVQVAVGETTFSVMGSIKWDRRYEGMLATPLRPVDVVVGHLAFVLVRLVIAAVVFLGVATALGTVRSWWALLAVPVAVLGGMAFGACVFAYSARLTNDQGLTLLLRFVIMPLSLFSGTFFPLEQLPGWLQPVAWATPLWHTVEVCRHLMLGTASTAGALPLVGHLVFITVWLVAGLVVSVRVLRSRMVT